MTRAQHLQWAKDRALKEESMHFKRKENKMFKPKLGETYYAIGPLQHSGKEFLEVLNP